MAAPRKGRREGWRFYRRLPGFGLVGPWQTGMRSRRDYERVAGWLMSAAVEQPEVVEGLVEGRYSLRDAWVARARGKLPDLLTGVKDPKLAAVVGRYRPLCKDVRAKEGLEQILAYAPKGARLSWLQGRNVRELYLKAEAAGRSEVSVYRSLHRAVRELLGFALGPQGRDAALYGVKVPKQKSRRKVRVAPERLRKLVDGIEDERFRWLVQTALLTAIDQGPLLRIRAEDVQDLPSPAVWIAEGKTERRAGMVPLGKSAAAVLRRARKGLEGEERVFGFTKDSVSYRWGKAREKAGLPELRFKDLRHLLPSYLGEVGMPVEDVQRVLRHANPETTLIYMQSQQGRQDTELLEKAAERMGIAEVA